MRLSVSYFSVVGQGHRKTLPVFFTFFEILDSNISYNIKVLNRSTGMRRFQPGYLGTGRVFIAVPTTRQLTLPATVTNVTRGKSAATPAIPVTGY